MSESNNDNQSPNNTSSTTDNTNSTTNVNNKNENNDSSNKKNTTLQTINENEENLQLLLKSQLEILEKNALASAMDLQKYFFLKKKIKNRFQNNLSLVNELHIKK